MAQRRDRARRPGPLFLLLVVIALAAAVASAAAPNWRFGVIAIAVAVGVVVIGAWRLGAASSPPAAPAPTGQRTDLIAAVSHDLRTPLATIGAYVELLEAGDAGELSGEQKQMLDVVEENVQRAYAIADDLIDLRAADTTSREPVLLGDVVARAVRAVEAGARQRKLTLDVDSTLGDVRITGNAVQLDRVLVNLLSNAVTFTPEGGTITVHGGIENGSAVVAVTDTGKGIPLREQERIFERYYRADAARAERVPGSGLGLSIVREFVAQHGGSVDVRSRPGQGATFTLRLPALAAAA